MKKNDKKKKKMQMAFLRKVGPNAATFKAMMDTLTDVAFYMKDANGRIMALNRRNCDICNIHDELDAIGLRSDEIFPLPLAQSYISNDSIVRKTKKPLTNLQDRYTADYSTDCNVAGIFPLFDRKGTLIGTTCIYRKIPSIDGSPDWHDILKPATEYINAHYAENITIDYLATLIKTSPSNFRLRFVRTFGISPGRYITSIRINAARKLLEASNKLVSEIAVETGFWDQSHLTKLFKRERGITPSEYRRRYRTEPRT